MTDDAVETPDSLSIAQRAWLLGKMQTSLMRDGWGVVGIDAPGGQLTVVDGANGFTVTLSIPIPVEIVETPPAAKKTSPKRKR